MSGRIDLELRISFPFKLMKTQSLKGILYVQHKFNWQRLWQNANFPQKQLLFLKKSKNLDYREVFSIEVNGANL